MLNRDLGLGDAARFEVGQPADGQRPRVGGRPGQDLGRELARFEERIGQDELLEPGDAGLVRGRLPRERQDLEKEGGDP